MRYVFLAIVLVSSSLLAYDVPCNQDSERVGVEYSFSEGRGTQVQRYAGLTLSSVSMYESYSAAGVMFQGNLSESISIGGQAGFYQTIRLSPETKVISSLDERISGPYYRVQIWYNFRKGD